jgi:tRNA(fMet)-specific endonuclease VapC
LIPTTEESTTISADLYARLRKTGQLLDDIDILIAGVAIANNLVFVTRNKNHFERIKKLKISDWSE